MRILIVEDEKKIASFINKGLAENNFVTDIAATGEDGLCLMQRVDYDLLILDVMGRNMERVRQNIRRVYDRKLSDTRKGVTEYRLGMNEFNNHPDSWQM